MKYEWNGNVLSVTNDAGDAIALDLDKLSPAVKDGALRLGLRTALRNATAGKMDDEAEGWKALKAKAELFISGVYEKETQAKQKVELTPEEKAEVIASVLVDVRRSAGDKREPGAIVQAFNELPQERQAQILGHLQKVIDAKMVKRLKEKKAIRKQVSDAVTF